jgi:hypothetical protein
MKELRPRKFSDFVDIVDGLDSASTGPLWYRGGCNLSHTLLPSLYRARPIDVPRSGLSELERELVERFEERSIPYQSQPLGKRGLETLFVMQHFGVPTRLLDWTENPFIGLFFAVRNVEHRIGKRGQVLYNNNAVVWVLDATKWNQAALKQQSYRGGPLNPSHEAVTAYKPIGEIENLAPRPVALYGAHNSPRIVAQQGAFMLFGSDVRPMEDHVKYDGFPEQCLTRVVLTRGVIRNIRKALFRHGISEAVLFPDLEGLARDLRRSYGFVI